MAKDCKTYALNEFQFVIQKETTAGTAAITDGGSQTVLAVDVVGNVSVTKGVYRDTAVHMGAGRTKKASDYKASVRGQLNTITFSSNADQTITNHLIENAFGIAVGTSPASYDIPSGFTSRVCIGDTDTDWTGLFTCALVEASGLSSGSRIFPACKVSSVTYRCGNSSQDGGRAMLDWTILTTANVVEDADGSSWTITAYPTDEEHYIMDLFSGVNVEQLGGQDVLLDSFSWTANMNVTHHGYTDFTGQAYVIASGMPAVEVLGDITVKLDDNSFDFFDEDGKANAQVVAFHNAVWASATYGFLGSYAFVRDNFNMESVNEGTYVTIPFEFRDNGSGDLFQVVL